MAFTVIGTLTATMASKQLYLFPAVTIAKSKGHLFTLALNPPALIPKYGYFLIIPVISIAGLDFERERLCKWFPKGNRFLYKYSNLENQGNNLTVKMGLYPVELFKGKATPKTLPITLSWDTANTETSVIVG